MSSLKIGFPSILLTNHSKQLLARLLFQVITVSIYIKPLKNQNELLQKQFLVTHMTLKYLTLQFPCRWMKASPIDSLMPVPATGVTADLGKPTSTIFILEYTNVSQKRCFGIKKMYEHVAQKYLIAFQFQFLIGH